MAHRVLLADDNHLMREGLAALLEREPDFTLVAQAEDGLECVSLAAETAPDVVVMDLGMPNLSGIDATRQLRAGPADVKIVILSVHDERSLVMASIDAGASGYVLKDCAYEELVHAVHVVLEGQVYLSPAVARLLVSEYRAKSDGVESAGAARLTEREREIVALLSDGYSTKQIAAQLGVSIKTVGTHREHIMSKLRIRGIAQLTHFAIAEGLVPLQRVGGKSGGD